ncbi:p53-like transcription factor [Aspergillus affinis]|uniref:p53-like transcription factor n=1 Tax=Aspergillus affinis TaxID=1070780 RepID=UPI0022FEF603|nr:p53-like transcription factor [Aspergillus affinis]KAI9045899.1 p53-like transcription factor [Aspergillus affinis]
MTTAGDGHFQLDYHLPDPLDFPDVNLDEFLNCFDDPPISLDLQGQKTCPAPNDSLHISDRRSGSRQDFSNVWPLLTSPNPTRQVVGTHGRPNTINMEASIHGLFFEADKSRTATTTTDGSPPSADLICYRRNLFKVNATVSLPPDGGYLALAEDQRMERIVGLHAQLHAIDSMQNRKTDLVTASSKHTPPAGPRGGGGGLPAIICVHQTRSTTGNSVTSTSTNNYLVGADPDPEIHDQISTP